MNIAAHNYLLNAGYIHVYVPANWTDIGVPEHGPDLDGHDSYDQYSFANETVYILESGEAHRGLEPIEHETVHGYFEEINK